MGFCGEDWDEVNLIMLFLSFLRVKASGGSGAVVPVMVGPVVVGLGVVTVGGTMGVG